MFFVLFSLLCTLLYFYYTNTYCKEWRRKKLIIDKLPGPAAYPVIGSICKFAFVARHERIKEAEVLSQQYGTLFRIWFSAFPVVLVMQADDVEVILASSKNIDKGSLYSFFKSWLGTGLLTSSGYMWHERRKMLTPAFHFSILESFFDIFVENTNIFTETLEKRVNDTVDIFTYVSDCALDIICESAMGVKVNIQKGGSREYLESVKKMTQLIVDRILSPWFYLRPIYRRTARYREQRRALDVLHGTSRKIISQRQEQRKERDLMVEDNDTNDNFIGVRKKKAFLDLLLDIAEESKNLKDRDIRDEVDTFMFEGHDTTSAAIAYSIYLLGRYPKYQETLYEELVNVFGTIDADPTMKEISELKYLDAVIKETLRLFPSVPFIGRTLKEDIKLRGYEIPSGTLVVLHLYSLHRQPEFFPNPEEFNPSNFLGDIARKRHPFAYVPFSAGPRNCIGQKFAMLEMKVILSTFFRKYKVESLQSMEELEITPDSILRPSKGIHVRLTKRC